MHGARHRLQHSEIARFVGVERRAKRSLFRRVACVQIVDLFDALDRLLLRFTRLLFREAQKTLDNSAQRGHRHLKDKNSRTIGKESCLTCCVNTRY